MIKAAALVEVVLLSIITLSAQIVRAANSIKFLSVLKAITENKISLLNEVR